MKRWFKYLFTALFFVAVASCALSRSDSADLQARVEELETWRTRVESALLEQHDQIYTLFDVTSNLRSDLEGRRK